MCERGTSASSRTVEKGDSVTGREPKAITDNSSFGCFAAMNARAPFAASASGLPRIDWERSMSSAIALMRPRFCASKPATGEPFSQRAGLPLPVGE